MAMPTMKSEYEDIKDHGGWIVAINVPEQTKYDFIKGKINRYVHFLEDEQWRTFNPMHFFRKLTIPY